MIIYLIMKKFLSAIKNVTDPEKLVKFSAQKLENFADYLDPNNEKTSQEIPFMVFLNLII